MNTSAILDISPLGVPFETHDPFLFCVHHEDAYPAGNEALGPAASLDGRDLGQDFAGREGWRMYHGETVPGFPRHPHRGFETVTIVRRGLVDHADSLGARARFGRGDVQWLTAGSGVVHSEMFPLVDRGGPNPLELFQIWLNLPATDKLAPPHFTMLWSASIPRHEAIDASGRRTEVAIIAGRLGDHEAQSPPPRSWARRAGSDIAIWTLALEPRATWTLPPAAPGSNRTLYCFRGEGLSVEGRTLPAKVAIRLAPEQATPLTAGEEPIELLLLQGRPIREPVVAYGPFVMGSRAEIQQAFLDYQRTEFGGWPWPSDGPVSPREEGRFARHSDGRVERPSE